jgi:hypothetical protein
MTTLVKANYLTVGQLWRRSLSHIKDTELLDMTRVRSHSYTSLRDVVAGGSLPRSSNNYKHNQNQLNSYNSLPNMRQPVHMRNPLVEKAARAYLATATHRHNNPNGDHSTTTTGLSSGFSSFLKMVRFPFGLFGGFTWFKQLTIKV